MKHIFSLAALAAISITAVADDRPVIELIYHHKSESHCYQVVQHRGERLKQLTLGKNYGAAPISSAVNIDVVELPAGWRADIITQERYDDRIVEMKPKKAPERRSISDKRTRILGDICLRFDRTIDNVEQLPYTFEISGSSRITSENATSDRKPMTESVSDKIDNGLDNAEDAAEKVDRFKDLLDR